MIRTLFAKAYVVDPRLALLTLASCGIAGLVYKVGARPPTQDSSDRLWSALFAGLASFGIGALALLFFDAWS